MYKYKSRRASSSLGNPEHPILSAIFGYLLLGFHGALIESMPNAFTKLLPGAYAIDLPQESMESITPSIPTLKYILDSGDEYRKRIAESNLGYEWPPDLDLSAQIHCALAPFSVDQIDVDYMNLEKANNRDDLDLATKLFVKIQRQIPQDDYHFNCFLYKLYRQSTVTNVKLYLRTGCIENLHRARTCLETAICLFGATENIRQAYNDILSMLRDTGLQPPDTVSVSQPPNIEEQQGTEEKCGSWWQWIICGFASLGALFWGTSLLKKSIAERTEYRLRQEAILAKLNSLTQNFFTTLWQSDGNNSFTLDTRQPKETINIDGQQITVNPDILREQLAIECETLFGTANATEQKECEAAFFVVVPPVFDPKKNFTSYIKRIETALLKNSPEYQAARERQAHLAQKHADKRRIADKKQSIAALKKELSSTACKIKCDIPLFRNMFEIVQKDANQHKSNPNPKIGQLTQQIIALGEEMKKSKVVKTLGKTYKQLKPFQAGKEEEAKIDSSEGELNAEIAHLQTLQSAVTQDLAIIAEYKTDLANLSRELQEQLAAQIKQQKLTQEQIIQELTAKIEAIKEQMARINTELKTQLQPFITAAEKKLQTAESYILSPYCEIANTAKKLATHCRHIQFLAQREYAPLQNYQHLSELWEYLRPTTIENLVCTLNEWQTCLNCFHQKEFHDSCREQKELLEKKYSKLLKIEVALNQSISLRTISSHSDPLDPLPQRHIVAQRGGHKKPRRQKRQRANRISNDNLFWYKKSSQQYIDDLLSQLTNWMSLLNGMNQAQERNLFGLESFDVPFEIGNCIFEAIAAFIPGSDGADIRRLAVTHIQQDQQLRDRITVLAGYPNTTMRTAHGNVIYENFGEYISYMSQNQTWGTEIELVALARALECPIVVLTPGNEYDQIIPGEGENYNTHNPIFLNYVGDNHYVPLAVPENQSAQAILEQIQMSIEARQVNSRYLR